MAETKQEERQRIILHKRKKEKERQQQKLMDVLAREPEQKPKVRFLDNTPGGNKFWYSAQTVAILKDGGIIDWDTTA